MIASNVKILVIVAVMVVVVVGDVLLVTFDGSPHTSFNFTKHDESESSPLPWGKKYATTGTWNVSEDGYGVLDADVRVEWDGNPGGWPGKLWASADGTFSDASSASGGALILTVRSSSPAYAGFHVAIGTTEKWSTAEKACGADLGPFKGRGCYAAHFAVPAGDDFVPVRIPFSNFSDFWEFDSGEQFKTCAEDQTACPSAKTLGSIKRIELRAQSEKGKAHLEVKSIAASNEEVWQDVEETAAAKAQGKPEESHTEEVAVVV